MVSRTVSIVNHMQPSERSPDSIARKHKLLEQLVIEAEKRCDNGSTVAILYKLRTI